MSARILNRSRENEIVDMLFSELDYEGIPSDQAISALMKAAFHLADELGGDQALDEAAALFADGFPEEE